MMKKQNGITLIALVITIIVLLILAGVSIAMLTGENGILNKATNATEKTQAAEAEEAIKLAVNVVLADKLDPSVTDSSKKAISVANITAANNDSNVTLATNPSNDDTDAKELGIDATIGDKTYSFTVNTETGKVTKK